MKEINNETIELILSEKFDENFWLFELGKVEANQTDSIDIDHQFMNSFFDNGERLWLLYKNKIQEVLCDIDKREPKEFVKEITSGNIKDVIVNIITLLTTTYSLTMAISIPLCAIALKKGIQKICD